MCNCNEEDLEFDLQEKLSEASKRNRHVPDKFDCDGSGMGDGYVMFEVYDIMLNAGEIKFAKKFLAGETIATFRVNRVYNKLCKQKSDYEGRNLECLKHKDLGKVHKSKCSCHSPHYLGNFMPYPGGGKSEKNHSTNRRTCGKTSLQDLHNFCHNENPFRMLMDMREYFELSQSERKSSEKEYIRAMYFADEDTRFRGVGFGNKVSGHGFYTQFKDFDHFVETLCFQDFVESDYFTQGYEGKNSPVYNKFDPQRYYDETMESIKKRAAKMLEVNGVKEALLHYINP